MIKEPEQEIRFHPDRARMKTITILMWGWPLWLHSLRFCAPDPHKHPERRGYFPSYPASLSPLALGLLASQGRPEAVCPGPASQPLILGANHRPPVLRTCSQPEDSAVSSHRTQTDSLRPVRSLKRWALLERARNCCPGNRWGLKDTKRSEEARSKVREVILLESKRWAVPESGSTEEGQHPSQEERAERQGGLQKPEVKLAHHPLLFINPSILSAHIMEQDSGL